MLPLLLFTLLGFASQASAATWYFLRYYTPSGAKFTSFSGQMVIPPLPQAGTYYLWPGLQPTDNSGVYQNVLDGRSGTWWIGSGWYAFHIFIFFMKLLFLVLKERSTHVHFVLTLFLGAAVTPVCHGDPDSTPTRERLSHSAILVCFGHCKLIESMYIISNVGSIVKSDNSGWTSTLSRSTGGNTATDTFALGE